jgi:hypothetical protein
MEKIVKTAKAPKVAKTVKTKEVAQPSVTTELFESATAIVAQISETTENVKDGFVDAVNEVVEKVDFSENVDNIKKSVKAINEQLKDSATEIVSEVKEMTAELKTVAVKGMKEVAKKVNLDKNVKQIKAAAQKMNTKNVAKVKAVVEKLDTQITENADEFKKTATKLANDVVENLKVSDRLTAVKGAVINANEYALQTTNELIDGLESNGTKWQKVGEKAVQTGLKLAENQQDLMFATLEAVKTQIGSTTNRFKKLFA